MGTVERLINSPVECKERGKKGRILAEKHYNVEKYNRKMISLYKEILNRRKKE